MQPGSGGVPTRQRGFPKCPAVLGWVAAGQNGFLQFAEEPNEIANITFLQTNGTAKVLLTNGDTFSYAVSNRDVTISSLLGELKIPCSTLRSLTFENPQSRDTSSGIVFACDFESEAETPNFSGGSIVEGKFGNALHVPPRTSAAKVELPAGSIGRQGTIEFWGRIDKGAYMTTGG